MTGDGEDVRALVSERFGADPARAPATPHAVSRTVRTDGELAEVRLSCACGMRGVLRMSPPGDAARLADVLLAAHRQARG